MRKESKGATEQQTQQKYVSLNGSVAGLAVDHTTKQRTSKVKTKLCELLRRA